MGGGSAPKTPDPKDTASAQTATNIGTAIANQQGALINQEDPYGRTYFEQTGTYSYQDPLKPNSDPYEIPLMTMYTEFTPEGQMISDNNVATQQNLSRFGKEQSAKLNDLLTTPVEMSNDAAEARIGQLQRERMDPYFNERRDEFESSMANRGIKPGTDLYERESRRFEEDRNDAYNQMFLSARGQAMNEMLTERNQPLNEITALLSGSQVSQPTFQATPNFNAPTTDYAGIVNQDYQNRLGAYNSSGIPIGGLFSGLGAAVGGIFG